MKVRLVKRKSIEEYMVRNAHSRNSFLLWLAILRRADWNISADMFSTFGSADLLGNGSERVVFNIGGNNYRMICKYHFGDTMVHLYIKWIGNHAEYSNICKNNLQYTINSF